MATPLHALEKAASSYNAAADHYDHPANDFWSRFGRGTIERLGIPAGARVLDVCCGSGASALPAAAAVGPGGTVIGVDAAAELIARARSKARVNCLTNVEFHAGDLLDLRYPDDSFDLVVCVFGIFFVPDMAQGVRELWRRVRPGGQLAITTWGPRLFEPMNGIFWDAVRDLRPELHRGFNPWDRIADVRSLHGLLQEAGVPTARIVSENASHRLRHPDDWWALVLGSGYRGTVEQLKPAEREAVHAACDVHFMRQRVREIEANVLYAVATRST